MTDDAGMFQYARYAVPDPSRGYTTDDNARALIIDVLFFEETRKQKYLDLVRYLQFAESLGFWAISSLARVEKPVGKER